MAQKSSRRLQTVLKLAEIRQQQAAEQLAAKIRQAQAEQQQLTQLHQYQSEYNQRFNEQRKTVIDAMQLANFQRFYGDLESAGETQQERSVLAQSQLDQARRQWQQQYSRQQNMAALIERKQQQEERELDNKLQREQDDRNSSQSRERSM